jgi:hypothetical protein
VAAWNIRSGMGISIPNRAPRFYSETHNCKDAGARLNAWGIGYTQQVLDELNRDPSVVALALSEAWNCGWVGNVQKHLGWKARSPDRTGVAMTARYGIDGDWRELLIKNPGDTYANAAIGADVCLDARCTATVTMYATHWAGTPMEIRNAARNMVDVVDGHRGPRLFMGDLNLYRVDRWNPQVPCVDDDQPWRLETLAYLANAGFVDAWKATQDGPGPTGMAGRADCGSPRGSLYKRVDYVMIKELKAVSTRLLGAVPPGTPAPSDHAMLVATLALPE